MKKLLIPILSMTLLMTACSGTETQAVQTTKISTEAASGTVEANPTAAIKEILETEIFDEEVATLDNQTVNLDEVDDNLVNITNAGNYVLTGTFKGQIRIEVNDDAQVKLTLSGCTIENEGSACIYFVNGDKLVISAEEDTVNRIINTGTFVQTDDENVDGAIYAKDDIQISGHGEIVISSEYGHGIVAKDDFDTKNVTVEITSCKKGIKTNDTATFKSGNYTINAGTEGIEALVVDIQDGTIDITAGDDGINASDGSGRSNDPFVTQDGAVIYISGGEITISAGGDGIDSNGDLYISGGTLTVTAFGQHGDSAIDYSGTCEITGGTQNVPEDYGQENMHGQGFGGFMGGGREDGMGGHGENMGSFDSSEEPPEKPDGDFGGGMGGPGGMGGHGGGPGGPGGSRT